MTNGNNPNNPPPNPAPSPTPVGGAGGAKTPDSGVNKPPQSSRTVAVAAAVGGAVGGLVGALIGSGMHP
jgi:hypothetical protein